MLKINEESLTRKKKEVQNLPFSSGVQSLLVKIFKLSLSVSRHFAGKNSVTVERGFDVTTEKEGTKFCLFVNTVEPKQSTVVSIYF